MTGRRPGVGGASAPAPGPTTLGCLRVPRPSIRAAPDVTRPCSPRSAAGRDFAAIPLRPRGGRASRPPGREGHRRRRLAPRHMGFCAGRVDAWDSVPPAQPKAATSPRSRSAPRGGWSRTPCREGGRRQWRLARSKWVVSREKRLMRLWCLAVALCRRRWNGRLRGRPWERDRAGESGSGAVLTIRHLG
jgi:hypothetical protein